MVGRSVALKDFMKNINLKGLALVAIGLTVALLLMGAAATRNRYVGTFVGDGTSLTNIGTASFTASNYYVGAFVGNGAGISNVITVGTNDYAMVATNDPAGALISMASKAAITNASIVNTLLVTALAAQDPTVLTVRASVIQSSNNIVSIQSSDQTPLFVISNTGAMVGNGLGLTNLIYSSLGTLAQGTGTVTVATGTLLLSTNYSYAYASGGISIETNSSLVLSNAGDYEISFGSLIAGANGDALNLNVLTNRVPCTIAKLAHTASAVVLSETGFKEYIVTLPAMCRVGLNPTNTLTASPMTLQNTVLNVRRLR